MTNAYAPELAARQVTRMREELEKRSATVDVMRNGYCNAGISDGNAYMIADCDFCLFLDKDKYAARLLEKRGVRLFDRADAIELCDDKMLTHVALAGNGIPMPDTVAGTLCYYPDAVPSKIFLDGVESRLGYPVVVKLAYGSMGNGVFMANDRAELDALAERVKLYPHLFQRYVAQSHGKDMRVIVIGDRVMGGIIRSSNNGDFRSNVGLGGSAKKAAVPQCVAETAIKAAKIMGLDYCGIDFLLSDVPMLCEVNSNAFFDAFEQTTGIDVAGAYAERIISETARSCKQ